jgi:transcriptional regulator of acetoin/glycerol metabolism
LWDVGLFSSAEIKSLCTVANFLEKHAYQMNKRIEGFEEKTMELMLSYPWPGNVRELSNAIERAVIFSQDKYILARDLRLDKPTQRSSLPKRYDRFDVINALDSAQGNISAAARILGVSRMTLYNYMRRFNIEAPE